MCKGKYILADCVSRLCSSTTFDERFAVYNHFLQKLGFESCAYSYLPLLEYEASTLTIRPGFAQSDNYPTTLLEDYLHQGLSQHDVSIKKMQRGDFSLTDFAEYKSNYGFTPDEARLEKLVKYEYGLLNTLSIPSASASAVSVVSVSSRERDETFRKIKQENLEVLLQITQVFQAMTLADGGSYQRFISPYLATLKPNERIVLAYATSGKPFKNIQDETGISYRYASNILDKLRARMGGITRDRLLYLTGLLQLSESDLSTTESEEQSRIFLADSA